MFIHAYFVMYRYTIEIRKTRYHGMLRLAAIYHMKRNNEASALFWQMKQPLSFLYSHSFDTVDFDSFTHWGGALDMASDELVIIQTRTLSKFTNQTSFQLTCLLLLEIPKHRR